MKTAFIRIFALIFFIIFSVLATQTARAQAPTAVPTPINTSSPACNQVAWSCAKVQDLDPNVVGSPHRMRLTQSGLPGKDVNGQATQFYVACGTETDQGFLLTTGSSSTDEKLCLGKNTFQTLKSSLGYGLDLKSTTNPFTAPNGDIDITVEPYNEGSPRHHMCMIGWELPATVTGSENTKDSDSNPASANSYGLEYTSFTFAEGAAQCTTIYSDPFGRVYNKQLRPVPGAKVSIFDYSLKSLLKLPGVPNPVTTDVTGIFNFNIPAGQTYLETNLTNMTADVHPNYSLAYTAPYVYGSLIDEKVGKTEQRDIPVSNGGTPVLKLMGYSHVRTGDTIHIQGIATWPLTMVDVMQGTVSVAQQQADKFGNFTFSLDPTRIDPTQDITLKLTEVDLTVNPKVPATGAKTVVSTFKPIPAYLEGYAYDTKGKIMPFATIRIRMLLSNDIYYETKADKDAFFTVGPRYIPILPYYLEFIPANVLPGGAGGTGGSMISGVPTATGSAGSTSGGAVQGAAVKTSVTDFAKQNKEYHQTSLVNIMAGTKNGQKVDPSAVASGTDAKFGKSTMEKAKDTVKKSMQAVTDEAEQARAQQGYITLLILVAIFIFAGSIAVVFMRKRSAGAGTSIGGTDSGNTYTKDESVSKPQGE